MIPLPHPTLPLATTPAFTPARAHGGAHSDHWQLALDRASGNEAVVRAAGHAASAKPFVAAAIPQIRQATATLPRVSDVSTASPPAGSSAASSAAPPGLAAAGGTSPARMAAASGAPFAALPTRDPLPAAAPCKADTRPSQPLERDTATVPVAARTAPPAARPPVRVHVERHAAGVTVWLGLDGSAVAVSARAAAVLAELQQAMPAAGQRLARVVCNGVEIHTAPHLEKETS